MNGFNTVGPCKMFICTKTLTGEYGTQVAELFSSSIEDKTLFDCKAVVLDLFNTCRLEHDFLPKLMPSIKQLQDHDIDVYCINAPKGTKSFLAQNGMDTAIKFKKDLDEVKAIYDEGKTNSAPKLDMGYANPFIEAVKHTMKTQANIEVRPFKPRLKQHLLGEKLDLGAIMTFHNVSFQFHITLGFTTKVALAIVGSMLGEELTEIDDDIADSISEMLNIIFGQTKPSLTPYGFEIDMVRPSTISGEALDQFAKKKIPTMAFPFKSEVGEFILEFAVQKKELSKQAA